MVDGLRRRKRTLFLPSFPLFLFSVEVFFPFFFFFSLWSQFRTTQKAGEGVDSERVWTGGHFFPPSPLLRKRLFLLSLLFRFFCVEEVSIKGEVTSYGNSRGSLFSLSFFSPGEATSFSLRFSPGYSHARNSLIKGEISQNFHCLSPFLVIMLFSSPPLFPEREPDRSQMLFGTDNFPLSFPADFFFFSVVRNRSPKRTDVEFIDLGLPYFFFFFS